MLTPERKRLSDTMLSPRAKLVSRLVFSTIGALCVLRYLYRVW